MNNSNYGYSPSGYLPPYASTPTGIRAQRPRFGYSGPSLYPRPRSSASKPNPGSMSDSMMNNYGTSTSQIDISLSSKNENSYSNDDLDSSNYFTADESFYSQNLSCGNLPVIKGSPIRYCAPSKLDTRPDAQFKPPECLFNSTEGVNNTENEGNPPKSSTMDFGGESSKPPFAKQFSQARRMDPKCSAWRCDLCNLNFTSQIPYDMHMQGARHAKKVKANQDISSVDLQVFKRSDDDSFFCAMCNVRTNSSLQLQTHLDGTRHKNKFKENGPYQKDSVGTSKTDTGASLNGNKSGSKTSLPIDFGEPQPSKLTKFACDVCNIVVNSDGQMQEHLTSKKHNNKRLGGRPAFSRKRFKQEKKPTTPYASDENTGLQVASKVVGVKTLASSFVLGETLK